MKKPRKAEAFRGLLLLFEKAFAGSCKPLTLAELGSLTSFLESVLLSLLHSGVAGQEPGGLQSGTIVLVLDGAESAADAMSQSAGLSGITAASDGGDDVVLAFTSGDLKGALDLSLDDLQSHVVIQGLLVDGDVALSGNESYSGHR